MRGVAMALDQPDSASSDGVWFDRDVLRDAVVPPTVRRAPWCFPWSDDSEVVIAAFAALRRRVADAEARRRAPIGEPTKDA